MQIYTSKPKREEDAKRFPQLGVGVMLNVGEGLGKHVDGLVGKVPMALDNGAFSERGFDEYLFTKRLSECKQKRIPLEFVVCPDIVAGGIRSLTFSRYWQTRLSVYDNLYLAVQDGMPYTIDLEGYAGVFVGGSVKWKWQTAPTWVFVADRAGLKTHIGQVGTADRLKWADEIGADSVDSTNFERNSSWHHIEEYQDPKQERLVRMGLYDGKCGLKKNRKPNETI